jgi:hypothetical protein
MANLAAPTDGVIWWRYVAGHLRSGSVTGNVGDLFQWNTGSREDRHRSVASRARYALSASTTSRGMSRERRLLGVLGSPSVMIDLVDEPDRAWLSWLNVAGR